MTYLRITQPFLALKLLPWVVPDHTQTAEDIVMELTERLKDKPDETFCLIAIEGKLIKAFMTAYKRENDVFGWQARGSVGFKGSRDVLNMLMDWTKSLGLHRIISRIKGERVARYYQRRYGFETIRTFDGYIEMMKAV